MIPKPYKAFPLDYNYDDYPWPLEFETLKEAREWAEDWGRPIQIYKIEEIHYYEIQTIQTKGWREE